MLTESVTVATSAHRKLLHIVLMLKLWLISSIEKSTPPIGEPKATATPAADAAVMTSRIFAVDNRVSSLLAYRDNAMTPLDLEKRPEQFGYHISNAACDMH